MKSKIFLGMLLILGFHSAQAQSCGQIRDHDKRMFCMARTDGAGYCGQIKNRDFSKYCMAVIGGNRGICGLIQNGDFRAECFSNF